MKQGFFISHRFHSRHTSISPHFHRLTLLKPVSYTHLDVYKRQGLAYASIYSTILPGGGGGFELDAIAGVVIGGTSMSGGYGTISGTLIGVFIMSVLKTGLPFVGLQSNWQQAVTGVVLVFAVFMDVMNRQKKKKV